MPQALLIAMLEEASCLDQSTQQAQTPLDQRYLGVRERWFLPAAQEPFHPHDGPLHPDLHARIRRFSAQIDGVEEAKSAPQSQAQVRPQNGIWQGQHPTVDGPGLSSQPELRSRLLHQGGGIRTVRGGQRVRNGLPPQAGPLIKAGRPQVQERDQFWLARLQTSQQGLSKEIMVPIPLPLLIQRDDKEIGPL